MSVIKLQGETEKNKGIYYQLDSEQAPIGIGGMGQVYKGLCVDMKTGATRPVAIKFMYEDLPPQAVERARREASIQLRNDNLVEMLGFIEIEEQTPMGEVKKHYHVVSELLEGVSLSDILAGKTKDRDGEDVPYAVKMLQDYKNDPEHFARYVVINVLSGLMALHDAGYIHRDIDPSNIMITCDGHIKLIDFGIAKQMNTLTTSDKALTVAGKFMGKPEYAAPELALGDIQHQNQTTDIYAVGVLLYQCLVGHTPFEGARHEILEKQLKEKMPLNIIKNKNLRNIISIACEKKQELRYQSSAQMRVALETMNGGRPAIPQKWKSLLVVAAVAIIVVLAAIGVVVKNKQDKAKQEVAVATYTAEKTKKNNKIKNIIADAEREVKIGMDREQDAYEESLMRAYSLYSEAEDMLKKGGEYSVKLSDVQIQKQKIWKALENAKKELSEQAVSLAALGVTDMASSYNNRSKAVEKYMNNNKEKNINGQVNQEVIVDSAAS